MGIWYDLFQDEKGENAMTIQATNQAVKVGDPVRSTVTGEYLGTVARTVTFYRIENKGRYVGEYSPNDLELAQKLSPEEAWAELPILILDEFRTRQAWGASRLMEYDLKEIRHQAYKLLGGSGVKVTEEVKQRVRAVMLRVASSLGIQLFF